MGQFYEGEPVLYPVWGYNHVCGADAISAITIPEDVIYNPADVLWSEEEALYFLWMVRSFTIKLSTVSEQGNPWAIVGTQNNEFSAHRITYPDDHIYQRVCTGASQAEDTYSVLFTGGGGDSSQSNRSIRGKFNAALNQQVRKIHDSNDDLLGFTLNSQSSLNNRASTLSFSFGEGALRFFSSFAIGVPSVSSWNLGGFNVAEKYIYPLRVGEVNIPVSLFIGAGNAINPPFSTWGHNVTDEKITVNAEYAITSSNRRRYTMFIELLDVELYQQAP